tara:strand:- start:39 stop:644 length:606 start_codon:yes stop_codon:yes gene_type:complete
LLKKAVILLALLSSVTCAGHGPSVFLSNENKSVYKASKCDPDKPFPQMVMIPFFKKATQIMPNCHTYPKHQTALAFFVFYHKWTEYFGDRDYAVRGVLEKVMVQWDVNKKTSTRGFDLDGKRFTNRTIIGRVESDSMTWVWQGYDHKISQSALFHELVHMALRAKNGTADPDHEGAKYRGWTRAHTHMIIEAKQMLASFDL